MPVKQSLDLQFDTLNPEERDFLRQAEKKFRANTYWLDFEDWAFSMRSPVFSRKRSHKDVLSNPLYLALTEMLLDLGEKQGEISPSKKETQRAGRKTRGSGTPLSKSRS